MKCVSLVLIIFLLFGCNFQKEANQKFGDQHFKTVISLIELHKIRFGKYPNSLKDLRFTGDWDLIALQSVKYEKVDEGYTLNVTNGWMGKPSLEYPPGFWAGLGIKQTNKPLKGDGDKTAAF